MFPDENIAFLETKFFEQAEAKVVGVRSMNFTNGSLELIERGAPPISSPWF